MERQTKISNLSLGMGMISSPEFSRLAADCLVHGAPDNRDETPHLVPGSIGILND